jgi:hypothetical protein
MKRIIIDSTLTVKGADPLYVYFARLNAHYPELELTKDNSIIRLVQSFGNPNAPEETIVRISPDHMPWVTHDIIHNRFNLATIIPTPTFTAAELPTVTALTNSVQLVDYMATKFNRAFTADSIWTEIHSIEPAGGTSGMNWWMKAQFDSMFWFGEKLVRLHP